MSLRSFITWFWVNLKGDYPGETWLFKLQSRGQRQTMSDRFQVAAAILLLALEKETDLFWGGPCGRECQAAFRSWERPHADGEHKVGLSHTPSRNWIQPITSELGPRASDLTAVPADTLMLACEILNRKLSPRRNPDPQKLRENECVLFEVVKCSGLSCGHQNYVHRDLRMWSLLEIVFSDIIKVRIFRYDHPGYG